MVLMYLKLPLDEHTRSKRFLGKACGEIPMRNYSLRTDSRKFSGNKPM